MIRPQGRAGTLSVASVAVMVSDRARSRAWYTEGLGLSVVEERGHWLTVGGPVGGRLHLCEGDELGRGFPLEPGNTGILLEVSGRLPDWQRELAERGVHLSRPMALGRDGFEGELRDPDGNLLLVAEAPRASEVPAPPTALSPGLSVGRLRRDLPRIPRQR